MKKTVLFFFFAVSAFYAAALDPKGAEPGYWAKKVHRVSGGSVYMDLGIKAQRGDTCNPTSAVMILKHYGIYESVRNLKDGGDYRYSDVLRKKLEEYDVEMRPCQVRTEEELRYVVTNAVDSGILLQWTVDLLRAPESDISKRQKDAIAKSGGGGHARIINGYKVGRANRRKDESGIYFADSWGSGNNKKRMDWDDAFSMTVGVFAIYPNNTPEETIARIAVPKAEFERVSALYAPTKIPIEGLCGYRFGEKVEADDALFNQPVREALIGIAVVNLKTTPESGEIFAVSGIGVSSDGAGAKAAADKLRKELEKTYGRSFTAEKREDFDEYWYLRSGLLEITLEYARPRYCLELARKGNTFVLTAVDQGMLRKKGAGKKAEKR